MYRLHEIPCRSVVFCSCISDTNRTSGEEVCFHCTHNFEPRQDTHLRSKKVSLFVKKKIFYCSKSFFYKKRNMLWLEDCLPLLRQIYAYDSTYHDFFSRNIIQRAAELYLLRSDVYYVFPYGLYEKNEDEFYIIIRLLTRRDKVLSMSIQYILNRQEWKDKTQHLKTQCVLQSYLTPRQLSDIYEFNFVSSSSSIHIFP